MQVWTEKTVSSLQCWRDSLRLWYALVHELLIRSILCDGPAVVNGTPNGPSVLLLHSSPHLCSTRARPLRIMNEIITSEHYVHRGAVFFRDANTYIMASKCKLKGKIITVLISINKTNTARIKNLSSIGSPIVETAIHPSPIPGRAVTAIAICRPCVTTDTDRRAYRHESSRFLYHAVDPLKDYRVHIVYFSDTFENEIRCKLILFTTN
ncbi:hypothetical protein EVAR_69704_1 [Eumeta japonica]|uniref:Uncharacterized protein n=1 Tax=Eumeta variegata TaxID=151549 RepID=A0A4C1SZT1_EUMVA|nr:hypothetical protein EVAR_69704_1 [Eumeta japonica]